MNYPIRLLSRSVNPFTSEILAFQNREPDRIIVLYDGNCSIAPAAGNRFFEKGIDNIFILSAGVLT